MADVCAILVGGFTSCVKSSSVIVESLEDCGFSKSVLKPHSKRISHCEYYLSYIQSSNHW